MPDSGLGLFSCLFNKCGSCGHSYSNCCGCSGSYIAYSGCCGGCCGYGIYGAAYSGGYSGGILLDGGWAGPPYGGYSYATPYYGSANYGMSVVNPAVGTLPSMRSDVTVHWDAAPHVHRSRGLLDSRRRLVFPGVQVSPRTPRPGTSLEVERLRFGWRRFPKKRWI